MKIIADALEVFEMFQDWIEDNAGILIIIALTVGGWGLCFLLGMLAVIE